jgi:molecular chaperone GrpE (heat shock protein)
MQTMNENRSYQDAPPGEADETQEAQQDRAEDEEIDLDRVNKALGLSIDPQSVRIAPGATGKEELIEEIADDMLTLLQKIKDIESAQRDMLARLEQIEHTARESSRFHGRELDSLRRDLLGERKAMSAMTVFNTVVPTLDSLRAMHGKLHHSKDARTRQQLDAVIQAIGVALRGLGFAEFEAAKGEPFDPSRMECLGYAKGEPGVVLDTLRPGYLAQETVIRPAGVLIADPVRAAK